MIDKHPMILIHVGGEVAIPLQMLYASESRVSANECTCHELHIK